jgi:hypothetical protein
VAGAVVSGLGAALLAATAGVAIDYRVRRDHYTGMGMVMLELPLLSAGCATFAAGVPMLAVGAVRYKDSRPTTQLSEADGLGVQVRF